MSSTIIPINVDRNVSFRDYRGIEGHKLKIVSPNGVFGPTFQGEGPLSGTPCVFVRLAGCNIGAKEDCTWCFHANEYVHTSRGKIRFDEVVVGDDLFTLDSEGKIVTTKVKRILTRNVERDELVCVQYRMPGSRTTKRLYCTKDHPFHTTTRGFVPAGELTPEDEIYHVNGYDMVAANKRTNNPMFDEEVAGKVSKTQRRRRENGELPPIVRTEEQRARYSASKTGDKNPMKRADVALKSALGHSYPKSNLEKIFEKGFDLVGIRAKYVGDNSLVVGDEEFGFKMPDFKLKGKKVIEIYHTKARYNKNGKMVKRTPENYEKPRREFYAQFGFDVMFLTDKDIPRVGSGNERIATDWKRVKEKVGMFERNGASIVAVRPLTTVEFNKRKTKKEVVPVINFSCGPENTFIVGGLHTHNCDTRFHIDEGKDVTITEVLESAVEKAQGAGLIVVSGGEPLLQTNSLERFVDSATCDYGMNVQVETNGYFVNTDTLQTATIVVSPKIPHNKPTYLPYKREWALRGVHLKYVVSADPSSPYHSLPVDVLKNLSQFKGVYVSGMCVYKRPVAPGEVASIWDTTLVDQEATAANYRYAADLAIKYNLKVSYQTHLFGVKE